MRKLFKNVSHHIFSRFNQVLRTLHPIADLDHLTLVEGGRVIQTDLSVTEGSRYCICSLIKSPKGDGDGWQISLNMPYGDAFADAFRKIKNHSYPSLEVGVKALRKACDAARKEIDDATDRTPYARVRTYQEKDVPMTGLRAVERALEIRAKQYDTAFLKGVRIEFFTLPDVTRPAPVESSLTHVLKK
jgi:hypothetical protein